VTLVTPAEGKHSAGIVFVPIADLHRAVRVARGVLEGLSSLLPRFPARSAVIDAPGEEEKGSLKSSAGECTAGATLDL